MRCFLGLDLSAQHKIAIDGWRDKALPTFQKPVPAANFHITLAFLGQINESQLSRLDDGLEDYQFGRCKIILDTLGFWSKPRILFLGTNETDDSLNTLASGAHAKAAAAGIELMKRPYVPHVTLVRGLKDYPPCALFDPSFEMTFDAFHLFESLSTQKGVRYPIRKTWKLNPRIQAQSKQ